ncbi:MAG: cereblon family protein [Desulfobacterales bacterium]|nr:cereblon family protein [Desulfobacterales bacterium]
MIPSWSKTDHLTYLKKRMIFEDDRKDQPGETALACASCGHPVTSVSEKTDVRGRHDHAFSYYRQIVRLGCFRNAPGCQGVQGVSRGYSWFRGYAWQIQVCRNCFTQLGWKYTSVDESFYGLIFETLREAESGRENGTAA